MTITDTRRSDGHVTGRTRLTVGGWIGVIGPPVFFAVGCAQELARADEFSPVSQSISALAIGPGGWIQSVNLVLFGVLTIVFAVLLVRPMTTARGRTGWIGPAMFSVSGLGYLLAVGTLPLDSASGEVSVPHAIAGAMIMVGSTLGIIATSAVAMARREWRRWASVTLALGIAMLVGIPFWIALFTPGAPLDDLLGVTQRFFMYLLAFPARIVISLRVLRR